jgi:hypothetical protein
MRGAVRNGFRALVILSSIFVGGTTAPASGAPMNDRPSDSSLPPGAIPAGEGIYMVPIIEDAGGCMQYRMYAPGRAIMRDTQSHRLRLFRRSNKALPKPRVGRSAARSILERWAMIAG